MKNAINGYKSVVNRTLDIVCKAQTWVSVLTAGLIWALSERVSPSLGRFAVMLTLISIPSLAWWGKRRIKKFEVSNWKTTHNNLDFSGTWDVHCRFISAIKVMPVKTLPPDNEGHMIISQTPFELSLSSCYLKSSDNREKLGGWEWLAASVSDDGRYLYTVYQMDDLPEPSRKPKRSHGIGFEKMGVVEWEGGDAQRRPLVMESYWYDCVRSDDTEPMYIGQNTYRRRTSG